MNTITSTQKTGMPKVIKYILGFVLFLSLTSTLSLFSARYQDIGHHLNVQLSEILNADKLGNVQSINTQVIGPYTFFEIKYFEHNSQKISGKGYLLLGFKPVFNCISSHPNKVC